MKRLLTTFAAFTALTAAATAADLPRRAAPPIFTPIPVFTWTGFYAGFNAGYGFGVSDPASPFSLVGTNDPRVVTGPGAPGTNIGLLAFNNRTNMDGFTGGGQIGYNYQFTPGSGIVIGVEADAQYSDLGGRNNAFLFAPVTAGAALNPGASVFNPTGLGGLDFFGTVRGRIGYAFDRVLFYGTGGFAYGSFGGGKALNTDDFSTGYAAGGGVEYALPTDSFLNFFRSSAVTFKVEGLYVNLDQNNRGFTYANAGGAAIAATPIAQFVPGTTTSVLFSSAAKRETDFAVIRAGINYKFGSY
ncbi:MULTISPECIES: outer membrane protein [Methylobacterium]|uniref:Porin n=1 Tax=Methylobacterium thuringiense TaxID=1003091 RepID=A0ABQ4TQ42_9HYPH|nr:MULTISPECIES: porin family protein [Methylobacterium]TXN22640.1 porin family protein [Methylobacterium sp. WL9]GJE57116.1 hypothetical protein EKPJFOCH_3627 [Methylobacterium thuringiense]